MMETNLKKSSNKALPLHTTLFKSMQVPNTLLKLYMLCMFNISRSIPDNSSERSQEKRKLSLSEAQESCCQSKLTTG